MANALIIAFGKAKKGQHSEPDGDEEGSDEGTGASEEEVAAFRELKAALKGDDDETGALALKNFISVCKGY